MRGGKCVPMIALCLLLCGCGKGKESASELALRPYQEMSGCEMEAEVLCGVGSEEALRFSLRCAYLPEGESTIEILAPESVAGIQATVDGKTLALRYEGACLPAGTLSTEHLSPAACLPYLMDALRQGWLLEENEEQWEDVPCLRLSLDRTGSEGGKILSTLWLRQEDGTPLRGEIAVDDEIILQAEFTAFQFHDKID